MRQNATQDTSPLWWGMSTADAAQSISDAYAVLFGQKAGVF